MIFTAEARVIASFTFIVALLIGAWASVERLINSGGVLPFESGSGRFALMLVPIAATAVAFQAARATDLTWAQTLGGAATMLGVLCSLAGLLHLLAYL